MPLTGSLCAFCFERLSWTATFPFCGWKCEKAYFRSWELRRRFNVTWRTGW